MWQPTTRRQTLRRRTSLLALLAGPAALVLAASVWLGSNPPSCVPVEPAEPAECTEAECGPAPLCPVYECPDGSLAGCTGRCLRAADGACGWEVRSCPDPCAAVPVCALQCPPGTHNPVDDAGCVHTCECVPDGDLRWYETCGDPVCGGWRPSDLPRCTTQTAGAPCEVEGALCDLGNGCNSHLLCARTDPRLQPGGCPISRRAFKQDVRYLTPAERDRVRDELLGFRLATYRYRGAPERQHLGFVIEDQEPSPAIDAARDQVDLYGYTSMVVATLQAQAEELAALRREVAALRARLAEPAP